MLLRINALIRPFMPDQIHRSPASRTPSSHARETRGRVESTAGYRRGRRMRPCHQRCPASHRTAHWKAHRIPDASAYDSNNDRARQRSSDSSRERRVTNVPRRGSLRTNPRCCKISSASRKVVRLTASSIAKPHFGQTLARFHSSRKNGVFKRISHIIDQPQPAWLSQ